MKTVATPTSARSAIFGYFSLFTSLSTLLCCALPSLLVLFGLGASMASVLSSVPWLVTLSRHKILTFSVAGFLIACSFVNTYYIVPHIRVEQCSPTNPTGCAEASRMSKVVLWISAAIYGVGFFVAFALGPILSRLDAQ